MQKSKTYHIPVLLKESIDLLKIEPGKKYIDATLGGGGHSEEIIKSKGVLLSIDRDPDALEHGREKFEKFLAENPACPAPKVIFGNFENIDKIAEENNFFPVDGILFDLGVSSHQLETEERGFSFNQEGPLDMRMDPNLAVTAKDLINGLGEGEMSELFEKLGEEKFARRYARAICKNRLINKIESCGDLAKIILTESPQREFDRIHPATRVFQALRIAVNDELNNLRTGLSNSLKIINGNGRIVVISFHSLEDSIVKRFFLENQNLGKLKIITKKPIIPTTEEVLINPRARSAKLRAAEKI